MLPLFPLNTLLFPGCYLDLQLFEARYLDMISRCLKEGHGFGVVAILDGAETGAAPSAFTPIGCEALIRDWQQLPNGLLGMRIEGGRRFEVRRAEVQPDQLTVAEVEWLATPDEGPLDDAYEDLAVLYQALARHPLVESLGMQEPAEGRQALGNRLAYLLPFSLEQKQRLLRLDDDDERLDAIQQMLERLQGEATN